MKEATQFPQHLQPDQETRAGRMLAAGDVRITLTDSRSNEHITVRFKAILDNRPENGERKIPEENRNWVRVPFKDATHVFLEVPSASGDFPDKIGTFYPRTGRFFPDQAADPERVGAAILAARWINEGRNAKNRIGGWRLQEESYCGVCGHQLTDPESIDIGIGPECNRKSTSSKHQTKQVKSRKISSSEKRQIEDILEAIQDLSDAGQDKVRRELAMWEIQ